MHYSRIASSLLLLGTSFAAPSGTPGSPPGNSQRAAAIKQAFLIGWKGYYEYAFPNDSLLPLTNSFENDYGGWGASAIDALDTAAIMGLSEVVNEILEFVPKIDYSKSYQDEQISLFETTIRYIGGMLSAYDLLNSKNGPLKHLATNQAQVQALLEQSENLANHLSYAFDTPTGIPYNNLYISNQTTDGSTTNGLATIGSLVLEWTHLSDLTGNQKYAQLAQKGESYLLNPEPAQDQPFPGLVGTNVDIDSGLFQDDSGGWIGGDDSFYEYLIKMYVYNSEKFGFYRDRWIAAANSSMKYLASHSSTQPQNLWLAEFDGQTISENSEHLACFDGGNFILGGIALGRTDLTNFGLQLVKGCHDTYASTVTGIGPEAFSWDPSQVPADQEEFFKQHGFYITDSLYYLRPEYLESVYYAYQVTGNPMYQEWGWEAFVAINKTCAAGSGYSIVSDVNAPEGGSFENYQPSFFFGEVLKYAYLIQAGPQVFGFDYQGTNAWVFNTEAHPFRVAGKPV